MVTTRIPVATARTAAKARCRTRNGTCTGGRSIRGSVSITATLLQGVVERTTARQGATWHGKGVRPPARRARGQLRSAPGRVVLEDARLDRPVHQEELDLPEARRPGLGELQREGLPAPDVRREDPERRRPRAHHAEGLLGGHVRMPPD